MTKKGKNHHENPHMQTGAAPSPSSDLSAAAKIFYSMHF